MTHPHAVIADWIEQIQLHDRRLTEWERGFIDSVAEQFEERGTVSDRQEEIIERIYADRT